MADLLFTGTQQVTHEYRIKAQDEPCASKALLDEYTHTYTHYSLTSRGPEYINIKVFSSVLQELLKNPTHLPAGIGRRPFIFFTLNCYSMTHQISNLF